ncbi:capsular exopolysaccharide family [Palleronia marisminoris]|uniref:non-specific protein-tyrosine kinase n=1 Tax=Palleronia marisminoris TaxID=315423 RepID=A0A1Y5T020_9RHOB|nr:polysaccharide biosynthesis tyrosine autokinase [Palleronia marisminoris]SFH05856.1 capsular exopolysaccharide family [Palleronia marisminoris]SLN50949.1 Putative tyrosine-protein kinase in cps region [Palleronia marisminoris]
MLQDTRNTKFGAAGAAKEIDLLAVLGAVWREKLTVLLCVTLMVGLGGYYAFFAAVPKYASTTSLKVELQAPPIVDIEAIVGGSSTEDSAMNTEVDVIRSRGVLEQLVQDLDLTADPEFNPALRPLPLVSVESLVRHVKDRLGLPSSEDLILSPEQETLNQTVDIVGEAVTATVRRDRYIFDITATTTSRAKSMAIADRLAELYIADQIQQKYRMTENAVTWLSDRVAELELELREREQALKDFRTSTDIVNLQAVEALNRQLADARARLSAAQADAAASEAQMRSIRIARDAGDADALLAIAGDETDPSAAAVISHVDSTLRSTSTAFDRQQRQVDLLARSVERLEEEVAVQSEDMSQLQQLERELQATRTLYETFLARRKEATVQLGLQNADSRILSAAVPGRYIEPRKSVIFVLSLAMGLVLGGSLVFARQFIDRGFRTGDVLESETGLEIIGQIPVMPIRRRNQLLTYLTEKPTSAACEAIRNLRTSVLLSSMDKPPQIIMSTSSVPGEGKTTQAVSLAHNLANLGKKVLLIEGDVRRRTLNEYFRGVAARSSGGGIVAALTGTGASFERLLVTDPRLNADILLGEKSKVNAADIFSSETFHAFLERLRETYDFIVIDTPPVLVVPDARVIGQHVDAIIFNVAWNRTSRTQVKEALRLLETVNLTPSGLVLSQIDVSAMKRYGHGGKHGTYGNYGSAYYDA